MGPKKKNNKKGGGANNNQLKNSNNNNNGVKSISVSSENSDLEVTSSNETVPQLLQSSVDNSDAESSAESLPSSPVKNSVDSSAPSSKNDDCIIDAVKEIPVVVVDHVSVASGTGEAADTSTAVLNEISKLYTMLSLVSNNVIDIKEKVVAHNNSVNGMGAFFQNQNHSHNSHNHSHAQIHGSSGNLSSIGGSGEVFGDSSRSRRSDSFTSSSDTEVDWKSMYLTVSQQYHAEKKKADELEIQVKDLGHENQLLTGRIKVLESNVQVEKKKLHQAFGTIRSGSKKLTMKLGKGNVDLSTILDELGRDIETISDATAIDTRLAENAQSMLNKLNSFTPHNSAAELLTPEEVALQKLLAPTGAASGAPSITDSSMFFDPSNATTETSATPATTPNTTPSATPLSVSASSSLDNIKVEQTAVPNPENFEYETQTITYKNEKGEPVTLTYDHPRMRMIVKVQSYVRKWHVQRQFKKLKTKRLAVGELFETESTYVAHLSNLLKIFVAPLRHKLQNGESLVSAHDIERIFSTASTIFKSNSIFLHQMEDMFKNFNRWSKIGNRMLEQLPLFESYIEYIINFDLSQSALKKALQSTNFANFIKSAEANVMLGDLDLPDLLIMPVQRIPRYIMLIQQIRKYTPHNHPDYIPLTSALDAFKKFADGINERKGMRHKALALEDKIIGYKDDITSKSRYLIREGPLRYKKNIEYVFLFNDMLMICHPQYKKSKTRLTSLSVSSLPANTSSSSLTSSTSSKDGSTSPSLSASSISGSTSPTPSSPSLDHHEQPCSYKFITRVILDARVKIVQDSHEPKFLTIIPDQYSIDLIASSNEERHGWVKDLITLVTIFTNNLLNSPSSNTSLVPNSATSHQ